MNRGAEKRARRAGQPPKPSRYDRVIAELRKMKIGPIFPGAGEVTRGMRGIARKATKRPFGLGEQRRPRRTVTIECAVAGCSWTGEARAWRPARTLRDAHRTQAHR